MKRAKAYFLSLTLLITLLTAACSNQPANVFQGYVEGEYVHIASAMSGTLERLSVKRGDSILKNDALFSLEHAFDQAAVAEATHRLQQAKDQQADLEKGRRPTEIAAIQAKLKQARYSASLARTEYKRRVRLIAEETISQEEVDRTKSDYEQKAQRVQEIESELKTARLGARSDEIRAAEAQVGQAEAKLEQAEWNLKQKLQTSPANSLVFDTLFRVGEWVSTGQPVVSLLPPENIEVRFFVPETVVGTLTQGQSVTISIDGIQTLIPATISYISPSAEFTPPVIYSSESRAKLVFMVKAKPPYDKAPLLHPGQPVDVTIPALTP